MSSEGVKAKSGTGGRRRATSFAVVPLMVNAAMARMGSVEAMVQAAALMALAMLLGGVSMG